MNSIKKDSIVEIEKEILDAMKNCNVEKLNELLHEELLFNIPNGQTITKAIDLETYNSGNMLISEISSSEQEINLIGDTAIVSVVIEMKGAYFDYSFDGKYKILRVWKLLNNQLKVIAGSSIGI
ncbi:nuclear transport factor 2 family protein [Flavivirga rizhaonensis]|uniref:Nuclear transport factor 2 family protein n=1 Tax=Flavivirga rizhaonensis TaxID=2559571 RepID=A0A4S1E045_9FLAO|nr:nuclear transport factor 2 family protein [Flavivirga rizhaonensis]TGV03799.1 nuclear transport factor 2 family protein [Flavivirga rizhaonensis]